MNALYMRCGKNRRTLILTNKRRTSRRCSWTTWNQFSRYFSGAWVLFALSKVRAKIKKSMVLKAVLTYWRDKKLYKRVWDQIQKWSSSTRDKYLIIWNPIYSYSRINACLCWQMQICIQRMAGRLFLEWQSKVGEFVFKVMRDIIQISPMMTSQ